MLHCTSKYERQDPPADAADEGGKALPGQQERYRKEEPETGMPARLSDEPPKKDRRQATGQRTIAISPVPHMNCK